MSKQNKNKNKLSHLFEFGSNIYTWGEQNSNISAAENYLSNNSQKPIIQTQQSPRVQNDTFGTPKDNVLGQQSNNNSNGGGGGNGVSIGQGMSAVSGTIGFVKGMKGTFDDMNQKADVYEGQTDNYQVKDLSNINDFDSLEDYAKSIQSMDKINVDDLTGDLKSRLGRYGSTSIQAAQAGSNFGPWGLLIGSIVGQVGAGLSDTLSRKKAEKRVNEINDRIDFINSRNRNMLATRAENIMNTQLANRQWDYVAALGGNLHTNSTTWSNGLNYIGSGGSHESNPNDGVAISTAPDGLQNKVEEGEVVWNDDYVFSRRLKVPKKDLEKNKWKGETYADVAKKLMDESAERPNDPITLRGLDDSLSRLRDSQDELKAKQEGNKIKKEIASMPPEMLAQLQQQAQQPTEEEIMQQQAMEQIPQEQKAMVDPSIQQPIMQQPPIYAKGGHLFTEGGGKYDSYTLDYLNRLEDEERWRTFLKEHGSDYTNQLNEMRNRLPSRQLKDNEIAREYLINKATDFEDYNQEDLFDYFAHNPKSLSDLVRKEKKTKEDKRIIKEKKAEKENENPKDRNWNFDETSLRYAPVWGSIFNVARSIANKPDYSNPERIERAAARVGAQVSPKYIGDYLRYKPLDESYYLNQLNAQQNAANNAIVGLSNGNRSMALASMLANDYNYNNLRGSAYRQGLEYNEAQRQRAAEFNRGTNQFNAQQYMQAAAQNASNRAQAANLISAAAQMREGIDNAYGASQSANWTSLFNNLGAVGKDAANKKMTKDLFDYGWGKRFDKTYNGAPFKRGGYLTIKTNNRRKE